MKYFETLIRNVTNDTEVTSIKTAGRPLSNVSEQVAFRIGSEFSNEKSPLL